MAQIELEYIETPSLTDWLRKIGLPDVDEFKHEDINKFSRLEILQKTINLPYDLPVYLTIDEIRNNHQNLKNILEARGDELCTIKIIPNDMRLPKIRTFGRTIKDSIINWFPQQIVDEPEKYRVEILKHNPKMLYSSTFIIDDKGIWGDIINGLHWQLTQGQYINKPTTFVNDFANGYKFYNCKNVEMLQPILQQAISYFHITDSGKQMELRSSLGAEFTKNNYLKGYFEFFVWPDTGIKYNDYNRFILTKLIKNYSFPRLLNDSAKISGMPASLGKTEGIVKIINTPNDLISEDNIIVVCKTLTLDYLPLMQKAAGIIAEKGSILSHFAMISRELKKPCIVGVENATDLLKDGDKIKLDTSEGITKL